MAAADDAQQLRIDGKLKTARERLLVCARPECPPIVRNDCTKWMSEVMALLPTIVIAARDAQGRDVATANVAIDSVVVANGLDGKPIEIDPGTHTLRIESAGATQRVEQQLLVREGEKGRPVTLTMGAPPAADTPAPAVSHTEDVAPPPPSSGVSPWTWVFGGVGVAAVAVGAVLELSVNSDASTLQGQCGHNCSQDQVNPLVIRQQILGPIAFGIGAASLGVATYLLFHRPQDATATARASVRWGVVPSPGGAVGGVAGSF